MNRAHDFVRNAVDKAGQILGGHVRSEIIPYQRDGVPAGNACLGSQIHERLVHRDPSHHWIPSPANHHKRLVGIPHAIAMAVPNGNGRNLGGLWGDIRSAITDCASFFNCL